MKASEITVRINVEGIEPLKQFVGVVKEMLDDPRIPYEVRDEYEIQLRMILDEWRESNERKTEGLSERGFRFDGPEEGALQRR